MANKSTRILIFSTAYLPSIGGAELALKEITDRIKDVEFDLIACVQDKSLPREEKLGNVNVYRVSETLSFILPKSFYPISAFLRASRLNKKHCYGAVFALQASQGGGAAWLFKLFNPKIPLILNLQEGKNLKNQGWLVNFFRNIIIKKADTIVAISNYLANYARDINPKADIKVIPNGVDIEKFKVESLKFKINELRNQLEIKDREKVIITVSRLVTKNGVGDLIDAFSLLNSKFNLSGQEIQNLRLLIIGAGSLEESLKLKTKNLNLESGILFLGEIGHEMLPEYLAIADVFIRPSLSEGLGIAFLEAMAVGVPVIGTNVGGISDIIIDKETGLLAKVGDTEDIAQKMFTLLNDNELCEKIKIQARKMVEGKFNWGKIASEYESLFKSLTRLSQHINV